MTWLVAVADLIQVARRPPARADRSKLSTRSKNDTKKWKQICADLFSDADKAKILEAFDLALEKTGQISFSALGQQAPIEAKETWDPDFAKRKIIQKGLRERLSNMSINMGGATSIDITQKGVDKGYGLNGIPLEKMMFIGDAIFPGGNDYPAFELGLKTVRVRNPEGTLAAIAGIVACLS
ncbi:eukaryotic phosphomannomutase [Rhypophila sp. PSN 637]